MTPDTTLVISADVCPLLGNLNDENLNKMLKNISNLFIIELDITWVINSNFTKDLKDSEILLCEVSNELEVKGDFTLITPFNAVRTGRILSVSIDQFIDFFTFEVPKENYMYITRELFEFTVKRLNF